MTRGPTCSTRALTALAVLAAVTAVLVVTSSAVWAYPPDIPTDRAIKPHLSGYSAGQPIGVTGGEFDIEITRGSLSHVNSAYTGGAYEHSAGGGFSTFCVQVSQYWGSSGDSYDYYVKLDTVTDHSPPYYNLTPEVAYLFHRWNGGALSDYDYRNTSVGRVNSARALQQVIWKYMDPTEWTGAFADGSQQKKWYDEAYQAVHGTTPTWTGFGSVRIMQLYNTDETKQLDKQDLLIETPEPGALALLAIGALPVLPIVRRRRIA